MRYCPRRARAAFYNRWRTQVGSAAVQSLFSAMFFAGLQPGMPDTRVEYRAGDRVLVARSLSRNFELHVLKNGYAITIVRPGKDDVRVNDPVDVRQHVPAA